MLREIAARLGIRRIPLLLASSRSIAPLAVGLGRPAVVLPERLLGAVGNDELQDVLVHELAHIRRGDQWIVLLQGLAAALYWPIVSVYGLNRELQRAREEVCDNVVLAGRNGISYGETLLHIAESLVNIRAPNAAVRILGDRGELERRIAGLIDPARNTSTTIGRKAACVVMCLFIAWGAIASSTRFAGSAGAAESLKPEPKPVVSSPTSGKGAAAKPPSATALTETGSNRTIILRGKVVGPDNQPVAGARFYLSLNESTNPVELGASDAAGGYRFLVPENKLLRIATELFLAVSGVSEDCLIRKAALIVAADGVGAGWEELPTAKGGLPAG